MAKSFLNGTERKSSHCSRRRKLIEDLAAKESISPQRARERMRRTPHKRSVTAQPQALLELAIEDLELTVRAYTPLKRRGIHTIGELVAHSAADLVSIRNFGTKSRDEVRAKLAAQNPPIFLKDDTPEIVAQALAAH
jgi:DNA-directed RNA polymerase alpha subunit